MSKEIKMKHMAEDIQTLMRRLKDIEMIISPLTRKGERELRYRDEFETLTHGNAMRDLRTRFFDHINDMNIKISVLQLQAESMPTIETMKCETCGRCSCCGDKEET